jgi:lysophospholipase L1-like esterase
LQSQRQIVREFAERNNYPLLDLYKLIYPNRYELVLPDGVHLSPAGHTFFAEQMAKLLRKYNLV